MPQDPNLNRGDWKEIEIACRKWAKKYGNIYIVCGPVFLKSQQHERIGPNQLPVPEAFFKVVLCTESSALKGVGFICRNTDGILLDRWKVCWFTVLSKITRFNQKLCYDMDDINIEIEKI